MNLLSLSFGAALMALVVATSARFGSALWSDYTAQVDAEKTISAILRCAARGRVFDDGDAARNGCQAPAEPGDWSHWEVGPGTGGIVEVTVAEPDAGERRQLLRLGGWEDGDDVTIRFLNPRAKNPPRYRHMARLIVSNEP